MPPRNKPLRNAINLFRCDQCNVGFSRQTDFDVHLGSYKHTHNKRYADLKQSSNTEPENNRSKGFLDARANDNGSIKRPVLGSGFTTIGGPGSGFKKVGKVTKGATERKGTPVEDAKKPVEDALDSKESEKELVEDVDIKDLVNTTAHADQQEFGKDIDVPMGDCESDIAQSTAWEEYDYTKPTDCDHANCPGCQVDEATCDYDQGGWFIFPDCGQQAMEVL